MARNMAAPGRPASLAPEQAVPILEDLIRQGEQLRNVDPDSPRVTTWTETAAGALAATFGTPHNTVDAFECERTAAYYPDDSPARPQHQFLGQLDRLIAVLRGALEQVSWKLPNASRTFFPAGSQHGAYTEIRGVVKQAKREILIVDSYVDDSLWTLLTNVVPGVKIRILTDQMKGDFGLEAKKFASQHGNTVEIRQTKEIHDRFIALDGVICWHLGASIKDAGNKACAIDRLEHAAAKAAVGNFESAWNSGRAVPI